MRARSAAERVVQLQAELQHINKELTSRDWGSGQSQRHSYLTDRRDQLNAQIPKWQVQAAIEGWAAVAAGIPEPGDSRDQRNDDLLVASMSFHFSRDAAGRGEYEDWKEAHAATRMARDEYREAAKEAEKAWKASTEADREAEEAHAAREKANHEFFLSPEDSEKRKKKDEADKKATEAYDKKRKKREEAKRKDKEARDKRDELDKKFIEEERIANGGEANCSPRYAELCIKDAWDECFYCETSGGTCTCRLMISPGMEWEPETQKELRENSRQGSGNGNGQDQNGDGDRAGGGGGPGRAADAAAPRAVAPADIAAGAGRNGKAGKGAKERGTVAPDDSTETPVGPEDDPKKDKPGRKGIAGVDPRAPSVAIQGKVSGGGPTVPSSDEEKKKTVAPSDGPTTTGQPEATTEHKPTVTPDDSSTTAEGGTSAKRPCMTCADAMNSIKGPAKTMAGLNADLECLWMAASRTTGANGKPLTDGLADEKAAIDKNLAKLASLDMGAEATAVRDEAQEQMVDLVKELSRRCGKAMRSDIALPHGTVAQEGKGTPPGGGKGGDGKDEKDDKRKYAERCRSYEQWLRKPTPADPRAQKRICEDLKEALRLQDLTKRQKRLSEIFRDLADHDGKFIAEVLKPDRRWDRCEKIPANTPDEHMTVLEALDRYLKYVLSLYCGEETELGPKPGLLREREALKVLILFLMYEVIRLMEEWHEFGPDLAPNGREKFFLWLYNQLTGNSGRTFGFYYDKGDFKELANATFETAETIIDIATPGWEDLILGPLLRAIGTIAKTVGGAVEEIWKVYRRVQDVRGKISDFEALRDAMRSRNPLEVLDDGVSEVISRKDQDLIIQHARRIRDEIQRAQGAWSDLNRKIAKQGGQREDEFWLDIVGELKAAGMLRK